MLYVIFFFIMFFFFNDTATTEIYTSIDTLSLHDALPISLSSPCCSSCCSPSPAPCCGRSEEHTSELQSPIDISYAVFCLKKKNKPTNQLPICFMSLQKKKRNNKTTK